MEDKIYLLDFTDTYFTGIDKHEKSGQKKLIAKIISFLEEIEEHPITGKGKPEALKGFGEHCIYSRRIDQKHRLTYEIFEEEKIVKMLSCYGHYED